MLTQGGRPWGKAGSYGVFLLGQVLWFLFTWGTVFLFEYPIDVTSPVSPLTYTSINKEQLCWGQYSYTRVKAEYGTGKSSLHAYLNYSGTIHWPRFWLQSLWCKSGAFPLKTVKWPLIFTSLTETRVWSSMKWGSTIWAFVIRPQPEIIS